MKAKDIEGFLVEKKSGITVLLDKEIKEYTSIKDHFNWGFNKALTEQGERELEIVWDREKLAEVLFNNMKGTLEYMAQKKLPIPEWNDADIQWKTKHYQLADLIISSQGIVTIKAVTK
jgi:hypothetical protein